MPIKYTTTIVKSLYNGYEMLAKLYVKIYTNLINNYNQFYKFNSLIICIIFLLSGCGIGSTNSTTEGQNPPTSSPYLQMANVATIPYTNYIHGEYIPVTYRQ